MELGLSRNVWTNSYLLDKVEPRKCHNGFLRRKWHDKNSPVQKLAPQHCYRLNVCVPARSMCWDPNPSVTVSGGRAGRGAGRGVGDQVMRCLIEETPPSPPTSILWGTARRYMSLSRKFSPDMRSDWTLTLDFPVSKIVQANIYCVWALGIFLTEA